MINLRLPTAPLLGYDPNNEAQTRRAIEQTFLTLNQNTNAVSQMITNVSETINETITGGGGVTSITGPDNYPASPAAGAIVYNQFRRAFYQYVSSAWTPISPAYGATVTPRQYGAYGDAGSHPISSGDIAAHTEWLGTYSVGTEWDTVGLQECFYAAFGGPSAPNSSGGAYKNLRVFIESGEYRVSQSLELVKVFGGVIQGAGAGTTTLLGVFANTVLVMNGFSYCRVSDMQIYASTPIPTGALVSWDWDGTGTHGWSAANQSCVFENLYLNGGGQYAPTDPTYPNQMHVFTGFSVGASLQSSEGEFRNIRYIWFEHGWRAGNYNALQLNHFGGNFENCRLAAIDFGNGCGNVYGVGFQNSGGSTWSQIAAGGYDILYSANTNSAATVAGCRTESPQFIYAYNTLQLTVQNCNLDPFINLWAATTVYAAGALVTGPSDGGALGVPYQCTTGGTSGSSQSGWSWTASTITDGTAVWKPLDYNAVSGMMNLTDCLILYGQVYMNTAIARIRGNVFSRGDWASFGNNVVATDQVIEHNTVFGASNYDGSYVSLLRLGIPFRHHALYAPDTFVGWASPTNLSTVNTEVGLSRADPNNNWLALYGKLTKRTPTIGDLSSYETDTAGLDLDIAGGASTGAGLPGGVNLQAAVPGASGALLNAPVTVLRADGTAGVTVGPSATPIRRHCSFAYTWTPGTITSGSTVSLTVSYYGVVLGDTIYPAYTVSLPAGLLLMAQVTAPDTVRVDMVNLTGSSQTPAAGSVRLDANIHSGLTATQSIASDIAQLATDLGGTTLAFFDLRQASTVTLSGSNVTAVADANGGALILTGSSPYFAYNATTGTMTSASLATLATSAVSALALSGALSVIVVGSINPLVSHGVPWAFLYDPTTTDELGVQIAQAPPQTIGLTPGTGVMTGTTGSVAKSPLTRLYVASKPSGTGSLTVTGVVLDSGSQTETSASWSTNNASLNLGNGSEALNLTIGALIVLPVAYTSLTTNQLTALRSWGIAKHSISLV